MPIDWTDKLQTRHDDLPREASLLPGVGPSNKRRVLVMGDHGMKLANEARAVGPDRDRYKTVYLYDENGRCNCSGNDSPFDLVNVADTLARAA